MIIDHQIPFQADALSVSGIDWIRIRVIPTLSRLDHVPLCVELIIDVPVVTDFSFGITGNGYTVGIRDAPFCAACPVPMAHPADGQRLIANLWRRCSSGCGGA